MFNLKLDKKDIITLAILLFFSLVFATLLWGKQVHIIIDSGREMLIPEQMLQGLVLYKDIFNIYGPLAYQINAVLYKIFGVNASVLYVAGIVTALSLVGSLYALCRKFLNTNISFLISLCFVFVGILKTGMFNIVSPYSYAMTYGLLALFISLNFLINFIRNSEVKFLYLSLISMGFAITCKYEYLPCILVYFYVLFFVRKIDIKEWVISSTSLLLVPILSVSHLFLSGLNLNDILYNLSLFKEIASAPSLIYFYKWVGVLFSFDLMLDNLMHFCPYFVLCILYFFVSKILKKYPQKILFYSLNFLFILLAMFVSCDFNLHSNFTFLPMILLLLIVCVLKKIRNNVELIIISSMAYLSSIKTFWYLGLNMYGIFAFGLLFLTLVLVLKNGYSFDDKKIQKFLILFFVCIMLPLLQNVKAESDLLKNKIVTNKGVVASYSSKSSTHLLIDYIVKNTVKDDRIVLLPEGHFINFLTDRKSDAFYNNLIPMYVEALGEKNIINHFQTNMPEYFVINNRDVREYGKDRMCSGYALELCGWIFNNYYVTYRILGEPEYTILRKFN